VSLLNSSCVASLYDKGVGMALEGLVCTCFFFLEREDSWVP